MITPIPCQGILIFHILNSANTNVGYFPIFLAMTFVVSLIYNIVPSIHFYTVTEIIEMIVLQDNLSIQTAELGPISSILKLPSL